MIAHSILRVAIFSALVLSLGAHAAKVYKWTDANGQTHFSSTPPPDQNAEQVQMRGSANVAAPEVPADPAAATDAANTNKPELSAEQREQLNKYCVEIRERINMLGQGGKVMERRPDGTQAELSPVDVADRVRQDKENERNYCKANGL